MSLKCTPAPESPPPVAEKKTICLTPIAPVPTFPEGNPFQYRTTTPPCRGLIFPVGKNNFQGYYNAQGFGGAHWHLGDDWNGVGGGNTDLGDPIYAIGDGQVFFAKDIRGGWGNVLRVVHRFHETDTWFESLYAHCDTLWVSEGDTVHAGQEIARIGNAHGIYLAHLHLEIRDSLGLPIGPGYGLEPGYVDPTAFIQQHPLQP